MNIIVFFTFGVSLLDWKHSGLLTRELKLYNILHKKYDVNFTFLTYGDESDHSCVQDSPHNFFPVFEKVSKSKFKILNLFKCFLIPFIFKKELRKADIYKSNQMDGSWLPAISKIFFKKKFILRMGYDWYNTSKIHKQKIYKRVYKLLLSKFSFYIADSIIVSNQLDAVNIKKVFNIRKKIIINNNWVDIDVFKPTSNSRIDQFLYVGRLASDKGVLSLPDYISEIGEDIGITFIGSGPLKDEIITLCDDREIKFKIIDQVPNNQLSTYYNRYKYFILNSPYEGQPKALLEAMSSGCIVFGRNVDGINNIIKDQVNGFLYNDNLEFKSKFNQIKKNKNLEGKVTTNSRKEIKNLYSLESHISKEIQAYQELFI